jgi:hypothetical protein
LLFFHHPVCVVFFSINADLFWDKHTLRCQMVDFRWKIWYSKLTDK